MNTVKVALILAALLLGGCGAGQNSFDNASGKRPPAALAAIQPKWQLVEPAAPTPDEQGVLRSPIDQMPIIPGNPNVAPMPGR